MGSLDFAGVKAAALARAEDLVPSWLPQGRKEGVRWLAANPRRPGSTGGGAFTINLHTGQWGDFAGSEADRGGDLISLVAYLRSISQADACRALASELGVDASTGSWAPASANVIAFRAPASVSPAVAADDGELIAPAPADAPDWQDVLFNKGLGAATGSWLYRDAAGGILQVIVRFPDPKKPGGKQFRPYTLWRVAGRLVWKPKALPKPWPLYHLDELARRPEALVMVCEGEKAADALQRRMPEYVGVTSPNGAKNASSADWSPLAGRIVGIWPDHDEPGWDYACAVRARLLEIGAADVQIIDFLWVADVLERLRRESLAQ